MRFSRWLLLFTAILLSGLPAHSQSTAVARITGHITDAQTKAPIELAEVALLKSSDNKAISGAYTNEKGNFSLEHLAYGTYILRIRFIGYKNNYVNNVVLDATHQHLNYPHLTLQPDSVKLKSVTVTGEKSVFQNTIDKKVFNVDKSVVSEGGSATDVLQTVPSVSIDVDGNVSLRGNGNVNVLIDGKPSGLTGGDRSAVLDQIPASSIEKIEIINNPSAKYDPDGAAGIINIILKKDARPGVNGVVSAGIGSGQKYNGSADLNYRNRKINAFTNYAYRYTRRTGYEDIVRHNYIPGNDSVSSMKEHNDNVRIFRTHLLRGGLDYFIDSNNTIGVIAILNSFNIPEDQTIDYHYTALHGPVSTTTGTHENRVSNDIDVTLNYKHSFKQKGRELSASATYSDNKSKAILESTQKNIFDIGTVPDSLYNTSTDNRVRITVLQADYTHPVNTKAIIEAGYKSIFRYSNNNYLAESFFYPQATFINDAGISNNFNYNEQVHGLYAMYTSSVGKFYYQAGLRAEQAFSTSDQLTTNQEFKRNYFNLFPTGHIQYKFNDTKQLQLSYSRKVNRPSIRSLNPFTDYTDPLNPRYGNPGLLPEYVNSWDLSYLRQYDKFSYTASLFMRQTLNSIQFTRILSAQNILYTSYANIGSYTSYGFEYIGRNDIYKWWNLTSNVEIYSLSLLGGTNNNIQNSANNWCGFAKIVSNMTLNKNTILQLTANYQSTTPISQGYTWDSYGIDAGVRQELYKNKLSLTLSLADVLNSRIARSYVSENGVFTQTDIRKKESRIATLNLTYRFGKPDAGRRKNNRNTDNDSDSGEDMP